MEDNVVRFADYKRRSKNPDAMQPRDPVEADVIVLPVIRVERAPDSVCVPAYMLDDSTPIQIR